MQVGLGLPKAGTDLLCCPEPLGRGLIHAGCLEPPLGCWGNYLPELAADVLCFQALMLAKSEGDLSSTSVARGSLVPDENIRHHLPALTSC